MEKSIGENISFLHITTPKNYANETEKSCE